MSDTISRQQAIDALKNDMASLDHIIQGMSGYDVRLDAYVSQRNQVNCDIDTINNIPTAQPAELETLIKALEIEHQRLLEMQKAQPEQRWIPVTERIPNKQTKVLVVDFGEVDTAYLNSEGRWMDFNGDKLKDVKAWMPLPKWKEGAE